MSSRWRHRNGVGFPRLADHLRLGGDGCRLRRKAEPRPAPPLAVVCHAAWKAAISTAADLRATLAAGAAGAS